MPDFGSPVATSSWGPQQAVGTLSSILGLQQQQQAIQSKNIGIQQQQADLQQSQQTAQQRSALANVNWGKYVDDNGYTSVDKMLSDPSLAQSAGDQFQQVLAAGAHIRGAQIQNSQALTSLNADLRTQLGEQLGGLRADPDVLADNTQGRAKVQQTVDSFAQNGPDAARVAQIYGPIAEHAPQGALARGLSNLQLQVMHAGEQAGKQAPAFTSTGDQLAQVNPQAAGGALGPQGNLPLRLGPQAVTDPAGNIHVIGGSGSSAPGVPSNGAPGWTNRAGAEGQVATAQDMAAHFQQLNASAQSLPIATALTKTIEGLAPEAYTGVGGDKKQYLSGLANAFGIKLTGDTQTDTNLLNKAMAQLNISTPAGSDAARALVQAGQPNSKMDSEAIKEAAGTIRGQVQMNVAERNLLNGLRYADGGAGNPEMYQQGRQWFEGNADPRLWQYSELRQSNPAAAKKFMQRQPDASALAQKAAALEKMGNFF